MKQFDVTSDGDVNIDFSHVVENPLINGIEIIDNDVPAPGRRADDTVVDRAFNGTTASDSTAANGGQTWSNARGAVMIDKTLYTGWSDGTLLARTYDGTTFGPPTVVDLHGLTNFANEIPNITGMFYDRFAGRLYYTLSGQSQLYYRYFTPQSQVVGAVRFNGPANGNGVDFANVSGMFVSGGDLYVGSSATRQPGQGRSGDNGSLSGTAADVSGPLDRRQGLAGPGHLPVHRLIPAASAPRAATGRACRGSFPPGGSAPPARPRRRATRPRLNTRPSAKPRAPDAEGECWS